MSTNLPLIDIAGLYSAGPADRLAVARRLEQACTQRGFFYVINHGVDAALIRSVFDMGRRFFALDEASKQQVDKRHSRCNRGYEPLRAQTLESGAAPDLKESFYIGAEVPPDDPRVKAGRFNTGPNQWPAQLPEFRAVMQAYYEQAYALGATLMRGMALSLHLPEDYFSAYVSDAAATLRLLHYPPQPANPAPGEKGCGAHTDFGGLTLLLQDDAGGLQVWDAQAGHWIDAPPVPGAYVVNIGDLMARWTNDRYVSTLHRVINRSGGERYSVPFFFTGNPAHQIACIPSCLEEGMTPRYAPVTVEEHQIACYQRTYGA
ncbi:isopenicillin N synthase family oxygenase [Corticibacter populi]|uniref:Isopenicillin N synthase family oxygenase n=1 Tax=Corticibacter populi TaxID=1550736 RepID=A0A3M6R0B6_9BURK|nr:2-oxoglutarate and iron-dependent oxygenase domain-containing protein [Corticibacter populi]RMX08690.1 isopenicillin N synthase family oxygenase [Corticibacter populi]RZS36034.1 isopenicillin N synthase-like dioxygenase [Corticibacter populi]